MALLGALGLPFQISQDEAEFLAGEDFRRVDGRGAVGDHGEVP